MVDVLAQELTLDPYRAFYDVMKYLNPNLCAKAERQEQDFCCYRISTIKRGVNDLFLATYRFSGLSIKIPIAYLLELEQSIQTFIVKQKRPQAAEAILRRNSSARNIIIFDFKLYDRIIIKPACYWHRNRQANQGVDGPEMKQCSNGYSYLVSEENIQNIHGRKSLQKAELLKLDVYI